MQHNELKLIIGSGLFWSWMDVLFMGMLFPAAREGDLSRIVLLGISGVGALVGIGFCIALRRIGVAMQSWRGEIVGGVAGTLASACCLAGGAVSSMALIVAGICFGAVYSSFSVVFWGAGYCAEDGKQAVLYVSGSFAFAFLVDVLLLAMIPSMAAVFALLLPIASTGLMRLMGVPLVISRHVSGASSIQIGSQRESRTRADMSPHALSDNLYRILGLTPVTILGFVLVMLCFGCMQYLLHMDAFSLSFLGAYLPQVARGMTALVVFLISFFLRTPLDTVFKGGFLVIVAGFLSMPFFIALGCEWVSAILIMVGYTTSDIFIWVLVVRVCCFKPVSSIGTILVTRQIINGSCIFFGAVFGGTIHGMMPALEGFWPEAIVFGYIATIATVLILCGKDAWSLFESGSIVRDGECGSETEETLDVLSTQWGLTQRESEIFKYLAIGRSQPWIAETLCIAESTAKTHIRHIYQKAQVNNKQALIDLVLDCMSTKKD